MREFSPEQQHRICFLAGRYATADEIANDIKVNCHVSEIKFFLDRAGLPPPPSDLEKVNIRIQLPRNLIESLDCSAGNRRIGRCEMAEQIIETVIENSLVMAVMDDALS